MFVRTTFPCSINIIFAAFSGQLPPPLMPFSSLFMLLSLPVLVPFLFHFSLHTSPFLQGTPCCPLLPKYIATCKPNKTQPALTSLAYAGDLFHSDSLMIKFKKLHAHILPKTGHGQTQSSEQQISIPERRHVSLPYFSHCFCRHLFYIKKHCMFCVKLWKVWSLVKVSKHQAPVVSITGFSSQRRIAKIFENILWTWFCTWGFFAFFVGFHLLLNQSLTICQYNIVVFLLYIVYGVIVVIVWYWMTLSWYFLYFSVILNFCHNFTRTIM